MRMLHPLRSKEIPVARGRYRYLVDGKANGHIEAWAITRLPDGTTIIRSDVDARVENGGRGLITHLQRHPDGRPAWLRLRYRSQDVNAAAQYTFEKAAIRIARQRETLRPRQDVLEIASNYQIDYHPVISHDAPVRGYPADAGGAQHNIPLFSPDLWQSGDEVLSGRALRMGVTPGTLEEISVPAGTFQSVRYLVSYMDGVQAIAWYDEHGVPLRWFYPDKNYDFVLVRYQRASS